MNKSTVLSSEFFERLERNFVEYADLVAFSYNGDERQITYKELNEISARVHGYLKAKGLKPDDFVMIKLPRGAEAGAVAIGVLRAGVAYTLCEEGYPQERIDFIYKDCACKLCIDSATYKEILSHTPVYGFEEADDHKAAIATYTSGTTGTPKSVLLERGRILEATESIIHEGKLIGQPGFRVAYLSSLNFVAFFIISSTVLFHGGETAVVGYNIVKDHVNLDKFFNKFKVNITFLTPSLIRLFRQFNPEFKVLFLSSESARLTAYLKADSKSFSKITKRFSSSDIFDYCKRNGVTASSFMHAAFAETFHRITRENEFLYTTVSNERSADNSLQNCINTFIQTLPVVFNSQQQSVNSQKLDTEHGDSLVADYVRSFHANLQETFANDCSPYTKLSERYKTSAEIMFIYQDGILGDNVLTDDKFIEVFQLDGDKTVFPVNILVYPIDDSFELRIEYDGMKYCSRDMQTLAEAIANTAINMTNAEFIKDVSLVSKEQETSLLKLSAGEKLEYNKTLTWVDMFRQQAAEHPDAVAVVDHVSRITYKELDRQSDCVAAYLAEAGVEPGCFVPIKMERIKEFVIAVLAVNKAGAGYVPVDPEYPAERIRQMVEDSEAKIVITEEIVADAIAGYPEVPPVNLARPETPAYMIYTSGSTGKPKGVVIRQKAVTACAAWNIPLLKIDHTKKNLHHTSFSFDVSTMDIQYLLASGGEMHILSSSDRKNLDYITDYIHNNGITGFNISTAMGMTIMNYSDFNLEYIMMGGEKMLPVRKTSGKVINGYGPTEFTVYSNYYIVNQDTDTGSIPIGRPVPNSYSLICDQYGHPVPYGMTGELCLAGAQIADGYWKRPELTAEKFAPLPGNLLNGEKFYRTGDLARYNENGEVECLGRIDFQVKLRGFRIELGEIDSTASKYDGIKQVVAQVKKLGTADSLVLYYSADRQIDKDELKSFMAKNLTDYMVPTVFMQLDEMPMTPNGKIDRKKLPEPEIEAAEIVAPADETEQKLFNIASEMLKTDKFGVTTSLISMGMTSLMAMRFAAAVQKQMNVKISVADIMKYQTIRLIVDNLGGEDAVTAIKAYPKQELYPLTENQRGLYIDWEMHRDTTQYNIPMVLKFTDKTAESLEKAVRTAFAAHGYLNTRFVQTDEDVMQKPCEEETEILVQKLDKEPDSDFFQSRVRPFDLLNERLYRVEIYKAPKAVYLFVDIHHIIYDGLSSAVLMNDILSAYDGKPIEAEKITAYDFALHEKEIFAGEAFTKAEARFDSLVGDASVVNYPASAKPDGKATGTVTAAVSADIVDSFCKKNSVTANSFMQAAFAETLHRITREENPLYVTISNGRLDGAVLERSMGMFVKTLPVVLNSRQPSATSPQPREGSHQLEAGKLDINNVNNANKLNNANHANSPESPLTHAEQSVSDYIRSIHAQLQESYASDFYPYTRIVERHGLHAGIMFAYQGGLYEGANIAKDGIENISLQLDTVKFPITLTVYPDNGRYVINIEYEGMKYSSHDMKILAEAVANTASSMTSAEKVRDISLVSEEQKAVILKISAGEKLEYNKAQTWVDMFKHQAEEHPDSVAVVDHVSSITYRELDRQSDAVAAYLLNNGVKTNDFVAIKMGRVKEFITAVLGINKAGAAYIPVDPDYPEERIRFMLEDSRAKAVLTESLVEEALKQNRNAESINRSVIDGLAYMIYTSGTTGKPKGAMILHRGVRAFVAWNNAEFGQCHRTSHLIHASFSFDASVFDMLCPLAAGSTVHILGEELRRDLAGMNDYITANHITGMLVNTSVGMELLSGFEPELKYIMLGGEKMLPVRKTGVKVYNAYGPTEFTAASTFYSVNHTEKDVPIGRPVPNSYGVVCDKYGHLLPHGIAGELCFAGEQIGAGYWERPELTEKAFACITDNVFNGQKVYHTGDLVRYNEDGNIEYLGRIDTQVKLRGFRIELGEIDNVASQFTGMKQVIAQVRKVGTTDSLVLYYSADKQIDKDELKSFISKSLTDYMVPTIFMRLAEMPMTPNGKIDRKKLPEPEIEAAEIVAPADETEQKLFNIASEMLKTDKFGVTTSLISMGMTSLMAMRFAAAVQKQMNVKVSVADIMKHQTIRLIAENLGADNSVTAIKAYPKLELYPLTENQRGLYIDWEMHRDTTQYNIPMVLRFTDKTAEGLANAVRTAFAAHDYLKTRFIQTAEDVMQKPCEEETEILVQKVESEPDAAFFQSRVRPFNLLNDRLYRVEIYKAPKAVYLFMDIHHIIYDGLSCAVLMNDIMLAYEGKNIESEKITAYDFALHEKGILASEAFGKAEARFDSLVGDAVTINYPSSAKSDGKAIGMVKASLSAAIVDKFCKENSVTANSFMQAAFAEALHRIAREEKPLYVTISNGRLDGFALERSMGMFVKTLPVVLNSRQPSATSSQPREGSHQLEAGKLDINNVNNANKLNNANHANQANSANSFESPQTHAEQSVSDFVQTMHKQLQESYANDFYPYTKIVERHGIHAGIMFVYQGGLFDGANVGESDAESISLGLDIVKFPLMFTVYPQNGKYIISVEYDGNVYCEKDIHVLAEAVKNMAISMTTSTRLKDCRLVSAEQEKTVLALADGRKLEYDTTETIVTICRNRAKTTPDATGVVYNGRNFTYKYIDEMSDRLAVYLKEKCNVNLGDIVGVMIHRSELMVIYPLAVMKAGAAYMPLDTAFPGERLEFMCNDAGLKVILTENGLVKEKLPGFSGTVFESCELEGLKKTTKKQIAELPAVKPDDRMVILFTSGSTGIPKAVELEHHGIVNFCHWYQSEFDITPEDRVAAYANFGFDAHMIDIYPSILSGAAVHILADDIRKEIFSLNEYLAFSNITVAFFTTQIGNILKDMKHSLRVMCIGGEKMPPAKNPGFRYINGYGPTECSIYSTTFEVIGESDGTCIGRPMPNYQLYVVDQNCQLVPQGVAGELLIAGAGVARGYMNRPELNAEKFIEFRPSADMPYVRAYRSGDLVKWNEDGNIDFIGRIDHQVKIRGLRIELGEIENRASEFGGMEHLIAVVKNIGESPNICLYYSSQNEVDKEKLRAFMAETLTEYMVPTVFMQVDKMPMTSNGKIDRKKLPEPKMDRKVGREPSTELESKLCAIFAEILGVDKVYADESFFNIGGTSLSAMKVVMKSMNSGIKFVYSNIFANPSPEALAKFIENNSASEQNSNEVFAPKEEAFADALKYNSMEHLEDITRSDIGNVLVAGANGFLGIHVVKKLIDNGCPVVSCLIRNGKNMSAETRLDMMFMYYFDETYSEMIGGRIKIINGDITDKGLEDTLKDVDYDTIINCAAVVKHFSNDDLLDRVNFHGVENLVEICCKHNKKLVQVSTGSIAGESVDNAIPQTFQMHENQHSFGQNLDNKYGRTKWLAEKAVLEAVQNRGLRGKIIRVGNLMSRASDGEFQANFRTNNFMNTLRAYNTLGCLPMTGIVEPIEFSPIDSTAEAVITLAGTPDKFTVFHAYNNHTVDMANVIDAMNACGLDIKIVKQSEFQKRFDEVMHDEKLNASISSLIAYLGNNSSRWFISCNNTFTLAALNALGFRWPIITEEYIEKAVKALKSMDFFE